MAFNDPKTLPLETPDGVISVSRPSIWNQGTLRGFMTGSLLAAGCASFAMFAPVIPVIAVAAQLVGIVGGIVCTAKGAADGVAEMQTQYDFAKQQQSQKPPAPPSTHRKQLQQDNSSPAINYRTDHAARYQAGKQQTQTSQIEIAK
jgi:hypothetical protein